MFCPECGTKNEDEAVFCENCGKKLIQGFTEEIDEPITVPEETADASEQSAVSREKSTFNGKKKIIVGEAVVLILLLVGIFTMKTKFMTPEHTAKEWVKSIEEQNWSKAYDLLYISKGNNEFLTKENFVTANSIDADTKEASDVQILNANKTNIMESSDKKKTITVNYLSGGETSTRELEVVKIKGSWKISANSEFIMKDVGITVPQGSSVSINKKEIAAEDKKSTKDGKDLYEFSRMFKGAHYIKVTTKGMQNYENILRPQDSNLQDITLQYKEEVLKEVAKQAQSDLTTILQAAADGKNGNQVAPISGMEKTYQSEAMDTYGSIRSYVMCNDHDGASSQFISLKLSDNSAEVSTGQQEDGKLGIAVNIDSAYNYAVRRDDFGDTWVDTESNREENRLVYTQNDGKWVLYQMELSSSY